jgi:cellulose synthase/poly-beta-1,6-N-acetylglucosamine synthase-like glycosyltransferase
MTRKYSFKKNKSNGICDLIIVIPFFNEAKRLPALLQSLYTSASKFCLKYHLILVNHNSTDNSIEILDHFKNYFYKISIEYEDFPIHCGGKPRSRGLTQAVKLVNLLYRDKKIPIATVDADVIVSIFFGKETIDQLKSGYDIVVFCERYNQKELLDYIFTYQKNQKLSLRSFIGMNWFRYQILWALILFGIKETRGSGYAMLSSTLQKLKHFQPLDIKGEPITGENNRLGIIANSKALKVYASPYYSQLHPRRELESCLDVETKEYVSRVKKQAIKSIFKQRYLTNNKNDLNKTCRLSKD